jgi:hypothetical protein
VWPESLARHPHQFAKLLFCLFLQGGDVEKVSVDANGTLSTLVVNGW